MCTEEESDRSFILGVLLVLGLCFCVLAFFCGEEIMRKFCCFGIVGILLIAVGFILLLLCCCNCKNQKECDNNDFAIVHELNDGKIKMCCRKYLKCKKNLAFHPRITKISEDIFSGFYNLEKVEFYSEIEICEASFFGCKNLQEINFYRGVKNIGDNAFAGCSNLTTITYSGTKVEWNAVAGNFGNGWKTNVPATGVTCSDGYFSFVNGGSKLQ